VAEDGVKVEVLGLDELEHGSEALFARIGNAAPGEFAHVAERVASTVRSRLPVLTGLLVSSVETKTSSRGALVGMGRGVPYAGWIEFGGTRGRTYIKEGRYLYPAALHADPLLVAAGEKAATREIASAKWPKPK
jgi:hypothetical protein